LNGKKHQISPLLIKIYQNSREASALQKKKPLKIKELQFIRFFADFRQNYQL